MCLSVVDLESGLKSLRLVNLTEVWILQGINPLKDEWVLGCSLKTRLADQTKTQQLKWLWSKDSVISTINQRFVGQTQETNFRLEGTGGPTLDDTLSVGSPQVSFPMCTLEIPQKLQYKFFCS